ncbi:MAG: hypothetical protein ACXVX0_05550 [Blastococcus sp.]
MLARIDTHKETLAVAVIDQAGRPLVVSELANTETGFDALEELLAEQSVRGVGIEGSGHYGRGAAVRDSDTRRRAVARRVPGVSSGRPGEGEAGALQRPG